MAKKPKNLQDVNLNRTFHSDHKMLCAQLTGAPIKNDKKKTLDRRPPLCRTEDIGQVSEFRKTLSRLPE